MISRNKKPKSYIDAIEKKSPSDHILLKYLKRGFTAKAIFIPALILFALSIRTIVDSIFYDAEDVDNLFLAYSYFFVVLAMLIYLFRSKTAFMDDTQEGILYIYIVNCIGVFLASYLIVLSGMNHSYVLVGLFTMYMLRLTYLSQEQRKAIATYKVTNYLLLGIASMLFLSYIKGVY
ncbi:MAG: hypothetical protein OEW60_06375 [Thiovulaceae bacterium]|nr:hypothetical protein [Sulfurimonadaceae bacterium]